MAKLIINYGASSWSKGNTYGDFPEVMRESPNNPRFWI